MLGRFEPGPKPLVDGREPREFGEVAAGEAT
jgi:hypothetical protein